MTEVWLNNMAGLQFENSAELVARHQALASCDGDIHSAPHFGQSVDIFRGHGLFTEERP